MEKNYLNLFIRWYNNVFHQDPLFQSLLEVSEDSPWHRESNIGIHTDMVVSEYIAISGDAWNVDHIYGALACAFHDVGKPDACIKNGMKWKPERGEYLSFGGHEQISARLWEDYAVRNWNELTSTFDLIPYDIFVIGWMIEHHLPWGVKKSDKLDQIAQTVLYTCEPDIFTNFLLADTFGRISDDEVEKRQKVNNWVYNFHSEICSRQPYQKEGAAFGQPKIILPIGPSGAGKSTFQANFTTFEHYSWDDLRLEFYDTDDYGVAFERSTEDPEFSNKVNNRFMELVRAEKDIYVDNTNLSKKRRRFFIHEARRKGYYVIGMLFPSSIDTLIDRQHIRPEKTVPEHAVINQYMSMQYPSFGEFDEIGVSSGNL